MTKYSGSLDANILLRLLLNDLPEQHQAAVELLQLARDRLMVADTVIIEIAFVLERHYEFSRVAIAEAVTGIASLAELDCNRDLFAKALPLFTKNPKLSFEDCCLAAYADLNDAEPLWTFDQKLVKQTSSARLLQPK
jgi:predicted nucleic-acid-binding protein